MPDPLVTRMPLWFEPAPQYERASGKPENRPAEVWWALQQEEGVTFTAPSRLPKPFLCRRNAADSCYPTPLPHLILLFRFCPPGLSSLL